MPPIPLFSGILLPALVCAAVLSTAALLFRGRALRWSGAVALAAGYIAAHAALFGMPPFPPVEATQWLVPLAFLSGAIGILLGALEKPQGLRWAFGLALAFVGPLLLVDPLIKSKWEAQETILTLAILCVSTAIFLWSIDRLSDAADPRHFALGLWVVSVCSSATLLISNSLTLAQLAGVVAATLGAAAVAAFIWPKVEWPKSVPAVLGTLLAGLLIVGHFYADLKDIPAFLLLASPLLGLAARRRSWMVVPAVALPSIIAVIVAILIGSLPENI